MLVREIEWRPPLDAFAPLAEAPFAALLHAGESAVDPGWSVLVAFPHQVIEARGAETRVDGDVVPGDAFSALGRILAGRSGEKARAELPAPFATGVVGYVGYEMGAVLEPTAKGPPSPYGLPDLSFGVYNAAALFDRKARRAFLVGREAKAVARLGAAMDGNSAPSGRIEFAPPASNFSREAYEGMVAEVRSRILEGDLFQANVAQQFTAAGQGAPFDIYQALMRGDAPFAAYLRRVSGSILSNSPERFFRVVRRGEDLSITAEPIKGTRPRGATDEEDRALAAALIADPKDRAENIMIADLMRNDLSRVCRDGSVREDAICELVSHVNVHHLVSRISGVLHEDLGAVDALAALFPCGSITGAPKVEAMRVIAELEGVGRGPYCGAIGYIDDNGEADFSVAIRTMIVERDDTEARATFCVGGGVTLRSSPSDEYDETLVKARGALRALGIEDPPH